MDRQKGKIVRGELLAFVAAHLDAIDMARADFIPWPVIAERLEIDGGRGGRRLIEAVKRARARIEKAGHKPKQNELDENLLMENRLLKLRRIWDFGISMSETPSNPQVRMS